MTHTDEVKAAAMAALVAGQSISEVAKKYKIPRGTVSNWAGRVRRNGCVSPTTKKEIGKLLLEYLETNLAALKAQARVFADESWIAKQDASDLAILHGVCTDKAVRLLEALDRGTEQEEEEI